MRKKRVLLVLIAVAVLSGTIAFSTFIFAKQDKPQKDDLYEQIELFANTVGIIKNDYVTEVDSKTLIYGALKGMLMSLDSHSQFLDPEAYKEIRVETEGKFGGLGIEITVKDGILTIISAIEDTPAFKAGLKPNDKIVRIDGKSTRDTTLNDAVKKMRGDPGTDVTLTILREDEKRVIDVVITRGIIQIRSVKGSRIIEDKIGYVKIVEFQENTPKDLTKALQGLKMKGMDSLILDLRNNPGGLLDMSVKVSELFLPAGAVVVSTKGRVKDQNNIYKAESKKPYLGFPLLLLVNEGSASASEIVAGALKDNKRAIIAGAKTFGKGSVQTVIPLGDGSALRLTTAEYFTPSGKQINNVGIMPDVPLPLSREVKIVSGDENPDDMEEEIFSKIEGGKGEGKEKKGEGSEKKPDKEKTPGGTAKPVKPVVIDSQLEKAISLVKAVKAYEALKAK